MSFIGAPNLYTGIIEKLRINLKPFCDLLHEKNTPWNWSEEHERLFQTLKSSITFTTELTLPNTKHPFFLQQTLHLLVWALSVSFLMRIVK